MISWTTQAMNTFAIVNGVINDYGFGASEGASLTASDNVMCLSNDPFFVIGGVYICGENENYFGGGFPFLWESRKWLFFVRKLRKHPDRS